MRIYCDGPRGTHRTPRPVPSRAFRRERARALSPPGCVREHLRTSAAAADCCYDARRTRVGARGRAGDEDVIFFYIIFPVFASLFPRPPARPSVRRSSPPRSARVSTTGGRRRAQSDRPTSASVVDAPTGRVRSRVRARPLSSARVCVCACACAAAAAAAAVSSRGRADK